MKYSTSILTLCAFAPLLVNAYPADTTLEARSDLNPACEIGFNSHPCKQFNMNMDFTFKPVLDSPLYHPHPSLPQSVGLVSHCFDFVDKDSKDKSKDPKAKAEFDLNGRTLLEKDKRPLFAYDPMAGRMWMLDDKCKAVFGAVAVFEKPGCQGSHFWYNLGKMADTTLPAVTKPDPTKMMGEADWCVAPFNPFPKTVGSFQLWKSAPSGDTLKLGA